MESLNRRQFLARAGMVGAGAVLARGAFAAAGAGDGRPNILFILADDASWCHMGIAGDPVIKTPTFDRVAREGVYFRQAYCASPSCTPSRGAMLTGRPIWQLEEGANLNATTLRPKFACYPDLLAAAGYAIGQCGKGWSPGVPIPEGRAHNPAGPPFKTFGAFLEKVPQGKPFCFWVGSHNPHRPYRKGSGLQSGMKLENVKVPPHLPDTPEVRSDILDYLYAIQQYDAEAAEAIALLERRGELENTIVVMTSDNGMPFPRSKSNLYDHGTHMPLAVRWGAKAKGGRAVDDFVSFIDFAPTFLEAAGVVRPAEMVGRSFLDVLTSGQSGQVDSRRTDVLLGIERHADCRAGNVGYPRRAIRTAEFLYIWNIEPARWPAGDPPLFGDCDLARQASDGSTKGFILDHRDDPAYRRYFTLAFDKRPEEELYDLAKDPAQMNNVAGDSSYAQKKNELRQQLQRRLRETGDPRMSGEGARFDSYPYHSPRQRKK